VDLGPDVVLSQSSSGSRVIVSPDGTRLAYYSGDPRTLFTRRLDEDKATELPGTEGDAPFFSPDSQWIGFTMNGTTKKVSVQGGTVITVANTSGAGGSWADNGDIFVGLKRIPAAGGEPYEIAKRRRSDAASFGYVPQALPGGKAVLFTARDGYTNEESATVEVVFLADGTTKPLAHGTSGRYVPSGHLLYTNKGTLFAIPFDLKKMAPYGNEVPILNDVARMPGTGTGQYDVSRDQHGTLVYLRASEAQAGPLSTIQLLDTAGKKQALIAKPGPHRGGRFSSDGKQLLFTENPTANALAGGQVFVWDVLREQAAPLTPAGRPYRSPIWYPGGKYVLLAASGQGIFWTRADGAKDPQPLNAEDRRNLNPWSITSDGKWLAYTSGASQIEIVPLTEENGQLKSGKPELMTGNQPAFSIDDKWIAYTSTVAGADGGRGRASQAGAGAQLYVSAFHPGAASEANRILIATNGGEPAWLPDGKTLIFRSGDQLMAVDFTAKGEEFVPQKPRVWIPKLGGTTWHLDPRTNNRVSVVIQEEAPAAAKPEHEVVLLLNFFDYLRQKVPVK
jgi:serine/threonine-protein kinase